MSEKFWKTLWIAAITGTTLFLLSISACNMHIDYCIKKAIEKGADPIEARVAFSVNSSTTQIMAVTHNRKEVKNK